MKLVKIVNRRGDAINVTVKINGFIPHETDKFLKEVKCETSVQINRIVEERKYIKVFFTYFGVFVEEREIISEYSELVEIEHSVLYLSDYIWINEQNNNFSEQFENQIPLLKLEIIKQTNNVEKLVPTSSEISLIIHDFDDYLE